MKTLPELKPYKKLIQWNPNKHILLTPIRIWCSLRFVTCTIYTYTCQILLTLTFSDISLSSQAVSNWFSWKLLSSRSRTRYSTVVRKSPLIESSLRTITICLKRGFLKINKFKDQDQVSIYTIHINKIWETQSLTTKSLAWIFRYMI